jgi:DNA-binding beta-propeller fold protein YncE
MGGESATIAAPAVHLESGFTDLPTDILGGHPLPQHGNRTAQRGVVAGLALMAMLAGGCKSNPIDAPPPTIETAQAAQSPTTTTTPAGQVLPLSGNSHSAVVVDAGSLVVLTPGADAGAPGALSVFDRSGTRRTVPLPGPATAVVAGGLGSVHAATRGGFFTVDLAAGTATRTVIEGAADADFTALARRADGRMVLGSADGVAYTLAEDMSVAAKADGFARVDAIAAQGDTAVVLDRGQTSVTALKPDGSPALALRAGLGATTITADPVGRVLVADTRGGQLLVYGVDPLIQRQAYPVGESPYGLAGSATLVWVSLTASNTVVGYDLATGIPVEKVRYPTVRQPNTLAYDEASDTLYVVSGAGAGVQVIRNAARPR